MGAAITSGLGPSHNGDYGVTRECVNSLATGIFQCSTTTPVKLWSINALADATGVDRRTIKKRLERVQPAKVEGNASLYHGRDAFQAIFGAGTPVSTIDASEARIKAAEADIAESKRDRIKEAVIEIEVVYKIWENILSAVRQKLDAHPSKTESRYRVGMKGTELRKLLEREIDEVLTELSKPIQYFKAPNE